MKRTLVFLAASLSLMFLPNGLLLAHCDSLDGPVVLAARRALESNNADPVLIWIQKDSESDVKAAFRRAIAVRKLGGEAQELADHYFFETVVRIHRAGEGAPYTGLRPAGQDFGPVVEAADKALADGNFRPVEELLSETVHSGIENRFQHLEKTKDFKTSDLLAGREHVKAYVDFVHYVEGVYLAAQGPSKNQKAGHDTEH